MINFLYGDLGTGKSTYIIEQIVNDCKNKTRSLLIVPEQQTVIKERQLASPVLRLWKISGHELCRAGGACRSPPWQRPAW